MRKPASFLGTMAPTATSVASPAPLRSRANPEQSRRQTPRSTGHARPPLRMPDSNLRISVVRLRAPVASRSGRRWRVERQWAVQAVRQLDGAPVRRSHEYREGRRRGSQRRKDRDGPRQARFPFRMHELRGAEFEQAAAADTGRCHCEVPSCRIRPAEPRSRGGAGAAADRRARCAASHRATSRHGRRLQ